MQFQISWNLCCYFVILTVGQWMVTQDNNKYISSQHPFFWLTHEHLKQVKQWCMRMEWWTPWAWFVYGNSNINAIIMHFLHQVFSICWWVFFINALLLKPTTSLAYPHWKYFSDLWMIRALFWLTEVFTNNAFLHMYK